MVKRILITGSTDGIGLEAARRLLALGHHVLLHGRNPEKLESIARDLAGAGYGDQFETYLADLSELSEIERFANEVTTSRDGLDVLINNAGVYRAPVVMTVDGLDVRFTVNAIAPYVITSQLLGTLGPSGRIVNVSSAAQASVQPEALRGEVQLPDSAAYAQSKLALTAWSRALGISSGGAPSVVSVNPGSLLGTKMVLEAFGQARAGVAVGAEILVRAALDDEFDGCIGEYFDNDIGRFGPPHRDAEDPDTRDQIVHLLAEVANRGR